MPRNILGRPDLLEKQNQKRQKSSPQSAIQRQLPTCESSVGVGSLLQRMRTEPGSLSPQDVLQLQSVVGNRAVRRLLAQRRQEDQQKVFSKTRQNAPGNVVQAKKLLTMGGEWEDATYKEYNGIAEGTKDTAVRGVDMRLEFNPNGSVDAEKIGLTQIITSLENGAPSQAGSDKDKFRQQTETQIQNGAYAGSMIDRGGHQQNNPIYGSDINTTSDLKNTGFDDQEAGFSQLGRRVPGENPVKAVLTDTPRRQAPLPPNSRQEFEATALAVKGTQEGTYYGSVQWGWETDGNSTFKVIDFAVKEFGNPTARFGASAQQWNQGHSNVGTRLNMTTFHPETFVDQSKPNVPLPIPGAPGQEALLPLPSRADFKSMKASATKKRTPFSGQLSTKKYGDYETRYNNALNTQKWQQAKTIIDELAGKLNTMNNQGDKYWISAALKELHFVPLYNAVRSLAEALEIKTAQLVTN